MQPIRAVKGKSATTSVPSIAIRFHTSDEELEELILPDCSTEDDSNKTSSTIIGFEDSPIHAASGDTTNSPKRDSSPMKDVFNRISKRSQSIDGGVNSQDSSPPASADRWRLFTEIKGKLTKTVEEKISEIKTGSKNSESEKERTESRISLRTKFANSKENSSVSDSEDNCISETSTSKFADVETTGTEDETPSQSSDVLGNFEIEKTIDTDQEVNIPVVETTPKNTFRNRFRTSLMRTKDKSPDKSKNVKPIKNFSIAYKNDENLNNKVEIQNIEVESGVEASEDIVITAPEMKNSETELQSAASVPVSTTTDEPDSILKPAVKKTRKYYLYELIVFLIILIIVQLSPLSDYYKGFLLGFLISLSISYFILKVYIWLYDNKKRVEFHPHYFVRTPVLELPAIKEYQPIYKFETWMNEFIGDYDPETYHISNTRSVWVRLEGNFLRVSSGKNIRVPKRAMWNEPKIPLNKMTFSLIRVFNMKGAKVQLSPEGLARKRYWSKKYPICLEFKTDSIIEKIIPKHHHTPLHTTKKSSEKSNEVKFEDEIVTPETENNTQECETPQTKSPEKISSNEDLLIDVKEELDRLSVHSSDSELEEEVINSPLSDISPESPQAGSEWDTIEMSDVDKDTIKIYLFTRTGRDKEEWYRLFKAATHYEGMSSTEEKPVSHTPSLTNVNSTGVTTSTSSNQNSECNSTSDANLTVIENVGAKYTVDIEEYLHFISKVIQGRHSKKVEKIDSVINTVTEISEEISNTHVTWANALIGRILYDTMREPEWVDVIRLRIQRKLQAIKLPYFMEELCISELELGTELPLIHRASNPVLDGRGVWVDLDITYEGFMRGILETKLNLMKLKKPAAQADTDTDDKNETTDASGQSHLPVYNSDLEDTAESSSEDETAAAALIHNAGVDNPTLLPNQTSSSSSGNTGKKILRMVDKIAASKYFQQATENKYIKRAMEGVSKTELKLYVEIRGLIGTLVVNIPPPPSHRIWIGFRPIPKLWLTAYPAVGEKSFNFNHISSWIEQKLKSEFQKIFVLPNMEDFTLPMMNMRLPE